MITRLEYLSCEERLRELGLFSLKKAPGRPCSSLPVRKRSTRKLERDFLQGHVVIAQRVMALNGKRVD